MPTLPDGMEIRTVENLFKPVDMDDLKAREEINISVALAFQISPENIGFRTGTKLEHQRLQGRSCGTSNCCRT